MLIFCYAVKFLCVEAALLVTGIQYVAYVLVNWHCTCAFFNFREPITSISRVLRLSYKC